jgi:hypothetical protein
VYRFGTRISHTPRVIPLSRLLTCILATGERKTRRSSNPASSETFGACRVSLHSGALRSSTYIGVGRWVGRCVCERERVRSNITYKLQNISLRVGVYGFPHTITSNLSKMKLCLVYFTHSTAPHDSHLGLGISR